MPPLTFDDLIPKGGPPQAGPTFDDLVPTSKGRDWKGLAADVLAYGTTPLMPIIAAARQGGLGTEAKAAVEGGRRTERAGFQGVSDSIADAAGMPVDMATNLLRAIPQALAMPANAVAGRQVADPVQQPWNDPRSQGRGLLHDAYDYVRTVPGRVADTISNLANADVLPSRASVNEALGLPSPGETWIEGVRRRNPYSPAYSPSPATPGPSALDNAARGFAPFSDGRSIPQSDWSPPPINVPSELVPAEPLGGSQFWRKAFDYAGTLPGRAVDAVNQGSAGPLTDDRTARITPQDTQERLAYGFGKGAGGAVTSFVPAAMVAQAAAPGSVAQGVAQQLASRPATQAFWGGAGGAVTEETKNPWLGMLISGGGAATQDLVTGGLKRLLTPTVRLTPDEQQIAAAAQARGIELTPAQATGSRGLQGFEATMRRLPVAGNMAEGQLEGQRQALNRQILAQAGVTADSAGPGVIDQAYRDMGQRYQTLINQQGGVRIDPQFSTDVATVARDYGRRLDTSVARTFQSYVDDLMPVMQAARTGQNPQVDAQWYQNVRSDLTRAARETTNGPYERAVLALRDALDSAAERTQPQLAPQWQELRRQYANLEMINKAMGSGTQDAIAGNIPLAQFRTAVRGSDAEGFARGRGGDMNELARIAGFLQNRVPNSGTPERLAMTGMLLGRGIGAPLDAAIGLAGPAAIQGAYQSAPVRQFLTTPPQPFMGQTAPTVEALLLQRLAAQLQGGTSAPR